MIRRRHVFNAVCSMAALGYQVSATAALPFEVIKSVSSKWPAWDEFRKIFLSEGGRVIDLTNPRSQTYSEGQSYALFFSLVANDRANFEKILQWTEDNLCQGDMTARLPAWRWGRRDDDTWGILDTNSASDADLWIAYALGEAGRLWKIQRYRLLSNILIARILREETANLPGLGRSLLPAGKGFEIQPGRWRLNPSYLPMHLMRWIAIHQSSPEWNEIADNALTTIIKSAPKGFVPDWIVFDIEKGFVPDVDGAEKGRGSYDAIRTYLWAGVLSNQARDKSLLINALTPMGLYVKKNGYPPESIDILTGQASQPGSTGFSAAILPFLNALGDIVSIRAQLDRIAVRLPPSDQYYGQVLNLFGRGWYDGFYKFDNRGLVQTRWKMK